MIRYNIYQNQNKENEKTYGKWYARVKVDETIDIEGLSAHMASHNTPFSRGAIKGILTDMVICIKELLLEGKAVKIDDLALFSVGIRGTGAQSADDFDVRSNITSARLRARATGELTTQNLKSEVRYKRADGTETTKTEDAKG